MLKGHHRKLATVLGGNSEVLSQSKGYSPEFFGKSIVILSPVTINIGIKSSGSSFSSSSKSNSFPVNVVIKNNSDETTASPDTKYEYSEARIDKKEDENTTRKPWWRCC